MSQLLNDLRCPVCQDVLAAQPLSDALTFWQHRQWSCPQSHSFDVARQGYLNLLLVQQKKSLSPGDSAESMAARRAFLAAGHYLPLKDAFAKIVADIKPATALDIGCGEGYYSQALLASAGSVAGIDISKAAIVLAAAKIKQVAWLVASAVALPFSDNSVSLVSSLFSPIPVDEIKRVLVPHGYLLVAVPAEAHLWSFREALFGQVRAHVPLQRMQMLDDDFELVQQQRITQTLQLTAADVSQLMAMTPYAWKAHPEQHHALAQRDQLITEAAFVLSLYRKRY